MQLSMWDTKRQVICLSGGDNGLIVIYPDIPDGSRWGVIRFIYLHGWLNFSGKCGYINIPYIECLG